MSIGVPANWLPVSFDDVFTQVSTSGKKVKIADALAEGKFPVVDQGRAFISGYLDDASLVVADDNPLIIFGDHTREIKWIDFPFIPGADGVKILKPHSEMDGRFLYFFLRNLPIESKGYARHFKVVRDAAYLVPPAAEQTRIAAKLDELLAQVDTLKARIDGIPALLKRFRQSVLAAAVSGRLTESWRGASEDFSQDVPPSWTSPQIKDVGRVQLGRQRSPKYHAGENMKPYLRVQNVFEDRLDLADVMEMDFPGADFERYKLHSGDILLNEGQSPELLGRPAMFCGEIEDVCFTNTLIRFQAGSDLTPKYALFVFRHYMHSGRFRSIGTITTNIAHLGAGRFAELPFPLPPLAEQTEIVRRVEQLFAFADQLEAKVKDAKTRIDRLTQSILAKAFRGELVPQDPSDEPASELLARIQAQRAEGQARKKARL